ncbi:ABC transporter ATP-binding protein [Gemmatimonas aurantiaca]|nr:ABC transporter ATP-binding protein [Gemmatimonas aurantiaca]
MSQQEPQEEALGKAYDSRLMKRLMTYVRPYLWHTVAGALSILVIGGLQIVMIIIVQRAIDDYIGVGDLDGLLFISLVYAGVMALKFGLEYFQVMVTARMGQEVQQDIRTQVFSKLQGMDLKFFDKNPVGRLVTRVTNDVNVLNELFSSGVINIIGDIVMLVGYVSLMLYYDWKISLAIFAILPLLGIATVIFRRKVRVIYRELRLTIARINAFVSERISGIQIIKLFAQEDRTFAEFDERNRLALDQNLKQVFYYAIFFPVVELIGACSLAILVVYGGYQISENLLTFGELTAFILLVERFYRPIRDLSEKYNLLQASMASSERIFQLLDTEPEQLVEKTVVVPLSDSTMRAKEKPLGAIKFSNVTFAYVGDDYVLKDVSFEIEPGENVAIVGATGAGKTSLISLLFRFYDYQSGTITLDGKDLREYDLRDLRSRLGLVLQDVQIFSGTVADNVRLGDNTIDDERVRWALSEVGFHRAMGFESISKLNIDSEVKERGATFSTGQKQLLSFARALAFDPAILALDEATSSVDTATERLIQEALRRIMNKRTSRVTVAISPSSRNTTRLV